MELKNFNGEEVNILHFQGALGDLYDSNYRERLNNKLILPNNLSIITTFTDWTHQGVHHQLEYNNIPYINAYKLEYGDWYMPNKVEYIRKALDEVNTEFVLILDCYDVTINSFNNIFDKFFEYNTDILWNATANNYPVMLIDRIPERDYLGHFNNLNAGCVMGYTESLKDYYDWAIKIHKNPDEYPNIYESEQYLIRVVFSHFSEFMISDHKCPVKFDYNCKIFACVGRSILAFENDEHTIARIT